MNQYFSIKQFFFNDNIKVVIHIVKDFYLKEQLKFYKLKVKNSNLKRQQIIFVKKSNIFKQTFKIRISCIGN